MGYVIVDNRAAGGGVREYDTRACCHCQRALPKLAGKPVQGRWCNDCGAVRCDNVACSVCTPFMKKIDALVDREARALALTQQRR